MKEPPVKAPPNTRRRMMPPASQQSSHSSTEERQRQAETEEESFGSAGERTVIAKMESYFDKSDELRVEFRLLEHLTGPEDSEVNLMYILTKASRRCTRKFDIFSTSGSDYLVASRNRWDCAAREIRLEEKQERMGTKATSAGLQQVKGWQEECWCTWRTAKARQSALENWRNKFCFHMNQGALWSTLRGEWKMRTAKICSKPSGYDKMRSLQPVRRDGALNWGDC